MGKLTISMAIFNSFLYVYQREYTYPHILFWLLQCLYITVCVARHSVFVLLINMIASKVGSNADSSFLLSSIFGWKAFALRATWKVRKPGFTLDISWPKFKKKMFHSTTVFLRIPITEVSRCPNSHCPFKTPIKMPKFHKNPIDYHRLSPKLPWIPTIPLTRSRQTSCACSDPFAHQWGRMRPKFRHFWDVPAQQIMDIEHFPAKS